jgi:hypothetical protein
MFQYFINKTCILCSEINIWLSCHAVVQCYGPTDNTETEDKKQFYCLLDRTLMNIHRNDIILMIGDLNAEVGNHNEGVKHIIG